jgi:acetyltransferase-like isoleucine patch superfamily enzyme
MTLNSLFTSIYKFILEKSSSESKVKYLRKKGIKIGVNCEINTMSFSTEPYLIEIGDNVGISDGAVFITHDAGIRCFKEEFPNNDIFGKIKIGNNVFIGINCTILPNTAIGDNCIVGAGSVVRGKFPENSVIVGNPAKILMRMNVQRMLYRQNPGLLGTANLTDAKKKSIVMKHFGLIK